MENTNRISNSQNNEKKGQSTITEDNKLNVVSEMSVRNDKINVNDNNLIINQADQNDYKKCQTIKNFQHEDNGSQKLIDEYNINDKVHSDSSEEDFIITTSNFKYANERGIKKLNR